MSLSQEEPPEGIDPELKEYLSRRFIDIDNLFSRASKFPERKQMPYKPQIGDIHYFGDPADHDYDDIIIQKGWWGFTATLVPGVGIWLNLSAQPAYGGVESLDLVALPDITTTPQVVPAAQGSIIFPQGVVQDFANDGIEVEVLGVFAISWSLSILCNELNSSRSFVLQLYDATDDTILLNTVVTVGRNVGGANTSSTFLLNMSVLRINDLFQMRLVTNGDTFSSVSLNTYSLVVFRVDSARIG